MNHIVTKIQLDQLINDTYVYAVVVLVVAVAIAFLVSNLIVWEGGTDLSYVKRRIAFIIIGVIAVLGFWLYNDLIVTGSIRNAGFQNMFRACNRNCIAITSLGYVLISLIIMFSFRHSKFGSILGRERNK